MFGGCHQAAHFYGINVKKRSGGADSRRCSTCEAGTPLGTGKNSPSCRFCRGPNPFLRRYRLFPASVLSAMFRYLAHERTALVRKKEITKVVVLMDEAGDHHPERQARRSPGHLISLIIVAFNQQDSIRQTIRAEQRHSCKSRRRPMKLLLSMTAAQIGRPRKFVPRPSRIHSCGSFISRRNKATVPLCGQAAVRRRTNWSPLRRAAATSSQWQTACSFCWKRWTSFPGVCRRWKRPFLGISWRGLSHFDRSAHRRRDESNPALVIVSRERLAAILPESDDALAGVELIARAKLDGLCVAEPYCDDGKTPRPGARRSIREGLRLLGGLLRFWWSTIIYPPRVPSVVTGRVGLWAGLAIMALIGRVWLFSQSLVSVAGAGRRALCQGGTPDG